ncbi:DUF1904 family protein [Salinispirillum marinum]|uniref:DUF1904 family protein n=2 Tax=Saccharospirillaceae TaxID=255527 RepID=A0ABV8BF57_9GAMM
MPQLIFHGIDTETVKACSGELVEQLAAVMQTDVENFLLEIVNSVQVFEGKITPSYPYIDVRWFDRGQDIQDRSAATIARILNGQNVDPVDIIFLPLEKQRYYENAEHF